MEKFSKDAGEGVVQRMQAYLCRNHSDEQLKGKLQLRRQHNHLKTAQQAVSLRGMEGEEEGGRGREGNGGGGRGMEGEGGEWRGREGEVLSCVHMACVRA